jgi:hypothetical protein
MIIPFATREWPNACVVRPCQRSERQDEANITTQTFMAGNYFETTARGHGQYQPFVSALHATKPPHVLAATPYIFSEDLTFFIHTNITSLNTIDLSSVELDGRCFSGNTSIFMRSVPTMHR